jgi:tetratricopeptide (TPR) repeat protein
LDALVALEIVSTDGEQYWLTQGAWMSVLLDEVDAQTQRGCHLRLAEVFEKRENELFRAALHWLLAGEQDRALDAFVSFSETTSVLTAEDPNAYSELLNSLPDDWQSALGTAIGLAREKGRPLREIFKLQSRLSSLAAVPGTTDKQHLKDVLERLERDSGLKHYRELGDQVEPNERLRRSLEFAQKQYDESSEFERVLAPGEAIRELSRSLVQAAGVVYSSQDLSLGHSLPSLEPLVHLSPALEVIDKLVRATITGTSGRIQRGRQLLQEILERLNQPDRAGLNETVGEFMRYGAIHSLGQLEAVMGLASCLNRASEIETSSLLHEEAQLIRMLYYLWQGNTQEAQACRQRAELLRIQNGPSRAYGGAMVYAQLLVFCQADELLGVKQAIGQIEELIERYPGWMPVLQYARGEYQRIRGNFSHALEHLEQALQQIEPGESRGWANIAGAYLKTLFALRRYHEARTKGRELLEIAEKKDIGYPCHYLGMPLALAEALLDDFDNAVRLSEAAIDDFKTLGTTGLNLGLAYETRAYVAIRMNDYDALKTYAELCAVEYKVGSNRALSVKHARLMEKARRVSLIPAGVDLDSIDASSSSSAMSVGELTSVLQSSKGSRERAQRALELLVKKSRSLGGFMYLRNEQGPVLAAENGSFPCPAGMDKVAEEYLLSELGESMEVTVTKSDDASSSSEISRWKFGQGEQYQPVLLAHFSGQDFTITGLVVLLLDPGGRFVFPAEAAAAVSRVLFEADDNRGTGS